MTENISPNDSNKSNRVDPSLSNINFKTRIDLLDLLSEETSFQIFTLLLVYKELTLSEIDSKMQKSRATIHRRLHLLEEAKLIEISRQEIKRGPIPANYYKAKLDTLLSIGQFQTNEIKNLNPDQYLAFKTAILQASYSVSDMIRNNMTLLQNILKQVDVSDETEYSQLFNLESPPLLMNFSLLTEIQKELYMADYVKFNHDFQKKLIDQNLLGLNEEKPHVFFVGFLPMQILFEKLAKKPAT